VSETIEIPIGGGITTKVPVGGGGTTSRLSSEQARTIQRFAGENGARVAVIGSRASGVAGAISDFDYIIEPLKRDIRQQAMRDLPRGPRVEWEFGQTSGMDIIKGQPLRSDQPHVIFEPRPKG
jgi:hypothetical protein